jgi:putative membrane-bound dehydrogenase-like protein
VYLDGKPEIAGEAAAAAGPEIAFGPFEGRIDEAAVFGRALRPEEIAKLAAGAPPRGYTAPPPPQPAPATAGAPKFPPAYAAAVQALKPLLVGPVREPKAFAGERLAVPGAEAPAGAYSVSLWLRNDLATDARAVTGYFFSRGPDGDKEAPGDHLGLGGNVRPGYAGRLLFFNGNARGQILLGRTVLPRGTWHHVVLVRDGTRVTAYLDGRTEPEFSGEADVTAAAARDLFLGARSDRFAPLEGSLAEFALFNRVLQPAEIARLYQAADTRGDSKAPAIGDPSPAPLSAADSLKKIHVPPGYEAELVAAEPMLLDPVAFDWDAQGRLWVVEMADYPLGMDGQGQPGGRVRILTDSDGDGRYDRSTLFADGLNFPNGILTWRDGCLITAAPEVVFLKDLDGDGIADLRRPLLTGFQEGNQQLRVNGLRWGLDGWVYCANGGHHVNYGKETSITSLLTGERVALGSRDFRFKPDTGEIDPLSGPSQFGRNRDAWGHWFGEQNSFPLWHYVLEDRYLRRNPHVAPPSPKVVLTPSNPAVYPASAQEKRYHSFGESGRFTSACSAAIYLDTLLFGESPERHSFTCEPFHNVVQHLIVADDGASFSARRDPREKLDFFASEDRWCRPVMTRTGPDGALWVADMYRFMIEHPQFLTPAGKEELMAHYRAGDDKGRLYRVFPAGRRPPLPQRIDTSSTEELVALFGSSNGWLRDQAQMILTWRGDHAATPLLEKTALSGKPLARLHALQTLASLGALKPEALLAALHATEPELRASALRLAESVADDAIVAVAVKLADDPDAKVRLQLALSLGAWKQPAAGDALAKLATTVGDDAVLRGAIMSSAPPHLAALAAKLPDASPLLDDVLQTALGGKQHEIVLTRLETLFAPEKVSTVAGIARLGAVLALLQSKQARLDSLAAEHRGDARWAALLQGQAELFARAKQQLPSASPLDQGIYASLLLTDAREASAAIETLGRLVAPGAPREALAANVRRLAQTGDDRVPRYLLEGWEQRTPAEREVILDALMGREAWMPALLAAVRENKIARNSFDAQRQARLLKHPAAGIRKLAGEIFAAGTSTRQQAIDAFQPALALRGDAAGGEKIFATICIACHQHRGLGKPIGPDLRSVVEHPPEKLLRSILDPSADIQPGFTAYFCELTNGEQLYGVVATETGGSVTLKLPDGTTRPVLRNEIKSLQSSRQSLMPDGLEATLSPQTMADLIAFLKTP